MKTGVRLIVLHIWATHADFNGLAVQVRASYGLIPCERTALVVAAEWVSLKVTSVLAGGRGIFSLKQRQFGGTTVLHESRVRSSTGGIEGRVRPAQLSNKSPQKFYDPRLIAVVMLAASMGFSIASVSVAMAADSAALSQNSPRDEVTLPQPSKQKLALSFPPSMARADARASELGKTARPQLVLNQDPEIRVAQMSSQVGMPRYPGAVEGPDIALGQRQIFNDLRSLQLQLIDIGRPIANAIARLSTQSDDLDIYQLAFSEDLFLYDGRGRLRPGVQHVQYTPMVGNGVSQYSAGFDGNYRIDDETALTGAFWMNSLASKNMSNKFIPTYDLFLTLWPSDYIRMDIDTKREIFDNITSLVRGITADSLSGSIDYMPSNAIRFSARAGGGFFSDGNDRQSAEAEAIWRITTGPTIELGLRASGFRFSEQLNNGYFNPNDYVSGEAMFRLQTDLTDKLNVELAASGGIESTNPGGEKPLVKSSLLMKYALSRSWTFDVGAAYFSSQESNSSGFSRTSINLGVHYRMN